ncbi:hypothetical protein [Roseateles depolymerans]|uniref:Uncharacterized protein n=1 Tax=Roseateles depolymerans TaxID=76731 RepID=A0A0U3CF80_9BURK|nr:hypothetical protein [Roseateles depolymerans]ALV07368.1 hypothetical protein RD2015_2905 [Roseateles depolymerans]REG22420.1 hypothetical protein DES44_1571 [Roseateles depolymerans]
MKYGFELRALPSIHDSAISKIERLRLATRELPSPWDSNADAQINIDRSGSVHSITVSKLLGKGLKGRIYYQDCVGAFQAVNNDDFGSITFDPRKVELDLFLDNVFLKYVDSFGAYFARLLDEEFIYRDFDAKRSFGAEIRTRVFRLPLAGYFSEELCRTSFGLSAKELVDLLDGAVDTVQKHENGLFLVVTRKIFPADEFDALSRSLHKLIRGNDQHRANLMPWLVD